VLEMGSLVKFLGGQVVLEEVDSEINGRLTVIQDLAWGTYIKGGGLTQSGGVAKAVWKTSLSKVRSEKSGVRNSLIVGLGGGSIAELIERYWPESEIMGVDIDPEIVRLGKKYLKLDPEKVEIVIGDAYKLVMSKKLQAASYDLICVDTYVGDNFPEAFESGRFLKRVRDLLASGGVAVFNRLYYDEKRILAEKFEKKLEGVFSKVERVYPEANVMFVCRA